MATVKYSVSAYVADGTTTDYLITWDYLDDDHITVEVDGVSNTDPTANHTFTKLNDTTVRVTDNIGGAITAGLEIEIRRNTPITTRPISFADGSALLAADLNKNSDYLLFAMQESIDTVDTAAQNGAQAAQAATEAFRDETEAFRDEAEGFKNNTQTYLATVQADATDADNHRIAAAASEAAAAASETAAATSETNAATSETNAATSETNAAASAVASAASAASILGAEVNSAASAAAAATSETNAATSETNAAASATTASTQATSATASATAASTSETNAATSETNAAASAATASTGATTATTQATAAATSATNAATSETNAATSEANAATSEANASTSETNAASSASAASASQVAAAASAAAAANSYDAFDDRYLGSAASDPTLDNDGDPLVAGSLYFNTSANEMRVYDGANWIAASSAGGASLLNYNYTATSGQTTFSGADDNAATMSYTQQNLIVTLNGIVLEDGTDYTASNGTSIVLTTGAAAGDELNVVAFKSFTTADMVPASTGGTFNGAVAVSAGGVTVDNDAATVLTVDRATSDGTIIDVQKDGTSVGSIGTWSGTSYIGAGDTGLAFGFGNNDIRPFDPSTVSQRDAAVDLGESGTRFKDLYLSGGVYLGGTGAANKLDDYEEGTWFPTLSYANTLSLVSRTGRYTKIGGLVYLEFNINVAFHNNADTSNVHISSLPFAPANNDMLSVVINQAGSSFFKNTSANTQLGTGGVFVNTLDIILSSSDLGRSYIGYNDCNGSGSILGTAVYRTNS